MDRKKRRVTYMTGANATFGSYGLNDESKKKKKKKPLSSHLRMLFAPVSYTHLTLPTT